MAGLGHFGQHHRLRHYAPPRGGGGPAGAYHPISKWLPSTLATAPVELLRGTHHLWYYLPAFAVTVLAIAAALAVAVLRLRAREI